MTGTLLGRTVRSILPAVDRELKHWELVAAQIPDGFLRAQALASLHHKRFHAEGGAVFALLAPRPKEAALVRFIVALQTISDYLDNLCDRGDCQDLHAYRHLHNAMLDAVDASRPAGDYYRYYPARCDGPPGSPGYLEQLVATCRQVAAKLPGIQRVLPRIRELIGLYNDLQVYKHGPVAGRVSRLEQWFRAHQATCPSLYWWEFAAASGSTLGTFALTALAAWPDISPEAVESLYHAYFPWIGGWHILLDYLIDQEEDFCEGDLNLVAYYPDRQTRRQRLHAFLQKALEAAEQLPEPGFHRWVVRGLPALYLSDDKVARLGITPLARELLQRGGAASWGLYAFCRLWRRWQRWRRAGGPKACAAATP